MLELRASGPSYRPGDRIVHSIMGAGVIEDIDTDQNAYVIKFEKLPTRAENQHEGQGWSANRPLVVFRRARRPRRAAASVLPIHKRTVPVS